MEVAGRKVGSVRRRFGGSGRGLNFSLVCIGVEDVIDRVAVPLEEAGDLLGRLLIPVVLVLVNGVEVQFVGDQPRSLGVRGRRIGPGDVIGEARALLILLLPLGFPSLSAPQRRAVRNAQFLGQVPVSFLRPLPEDINELALICDRRHLFQEGGRQRAMKRRKVDPLEAGGILDAFVFRRRDLTREKFDGHVLEVQPPGGEEVEDSAPRVRVEVATHDDGVLQSPRHFVDPGQKGHQLRQFHVASFGVEEEVGVGHAQPKVVQFLRWEKKSRNFRKLFCY